MCNVCVADEAIKGVFEYAHLGHTTVQVRAHGESEGPSTYQIRRKGERWPSTWSKSNDLAGTMGMFGFDVKWRYVSLIVRQWIDGKTKHKPTEYELRSELATYIKKRSRTRR